MELLEYEVFLSFRGPDVRKSFADYLYSYLVRSKIRTFRDEEELHKGEKIAPSLIQAITESKVYIPILTRSYASSKWCLQELAKMVECCKKQGKGHIILPIFYFLDPRDVRHQAGPYKEAFEHHHQKHDLETVQEWRRALQEVGQMKGWHVTESDGDMRQAGGLELTDKDFKKLSGLKYLEVMYGTLVGDFSEIIPDLRWLRLNDCPSIPIDLNLQKVVVLNLQYSQVTDDWRGWSRMKDGTCSELKVLNLYNCQHLTRVPELSQCRKLEWIELNCCFYMTGELHVGNFKNLKVIRFQVTKITKLTGDMGKLKELQELETGKLVWRGEEEEVPVLPTSLKRLTISSPRVPNLLELKELEELRFDDCDAAPEIPSDIWKLSKLKNLSLFNCRSYSTDNGSLLTAQNYGECAHLRSSLTCLRIQGSCYLNSLPDLGNLSNLTELLLFETGVCEIHGLGELRMLETIQVCTAFSLYHLKGLENLVKLKALNVAGCFLGGGGLPSLSNLTNLELLAITGCPLISQIQGLGELGRSLLHLVIQSPHCLRNIEDIQSLEALEILDLTIENLAPENEDIVPEKFPDLSRLQKLKSLSVKGWRRLSVIRGLERLISLRFLFIRGCTSLRRLPDLSGLENLEKLEIEGCICLVDVAGCARLESLLELSVSGCELIQDLPDMSGFRKLKVLYVSECLGLTKVVGLERLESLRKLGICRCKSIKELNLTGCTELKRVKGLEALEHLQGVEMDIRLEVKYRLKLAASAGKKLTRSALGSLRNRR